jgi:dTDP-4-dehydrorhamnose 3,5-epimerase
MKVVCRPFKGVAVLQPHRFEDSRGFFLESFEENRYRDLGITENFVQDNHSRSARNVLRGLHFTKMRPQAQLLTVIRGRILDVVVDVRPKSPTFGKWFGIELSEDGPPQIYMAHGFAHGFYVLSDYADLHYKVSQKYDPLDECGIVWNDPAIGIDWQCAAPNVSDRDSKHPSLNDHFK